MNSVRKVDVAVVGAGLSGLTAAWRLQQAGCTVVVAEAAHRCGGRLKNSNPVSGVPLEMGGAWTGPSQDAVHALADELGVRRYSSQAHRAGDVLWDADGRVERFDGLEPPLGEAGKACYRRAVSELDSLSRAIAPECPWNAANAAQLDAMTLADWLERNVTDPRIVQYLGQRFTAMLAMPPTLVSMLYVLYFLATCGGFESSRAGASQRFEGGSQELALRLADRMGGSVLFESPVRTLRMSTSGVSVDATSCTIEARKVIVACSPKDAGRIMFTPNLPPRRQLLHDRLPMGGCIKMHAVYDTPFWREDGLNGAVASDRPDTRVVYDHTPAAGTPGVLTTLIVHHPATHFGPTPDVLDDPDLRARRFVHNLVDLFGRKAEHPITVLQQDWLSETWVGGCESPFPPHLLTLVGDALRAPVGDIHWAGTETSTQWIGFMDGAVHAGQRAAEEVVSLLQPCTVSPAPGLHHSHLPR
ncbi:flavin monoamine oxidase family protein [Rhodococcus wratislaviensis]|uniref:flavin monoamine oxidase family protein n=1 Tax=Rhodococcus wratislaviensis TaxID=44752 RepID=UPI0035156B10